MVSEVIARHWFKWTWLTSVSEDDGQKERRSQLRRQICFFRFKFTRCFPSHFFTFVIPDS